MKKWLAEGKRPEVEKRKQRDERKDVDRKEDTKGMPRKEQVAISRLRTGYTRTSHDPKMQRY
jgi:hypothetical protein